MPRPRKKVGRPAGSTKAKKSKTAKTHAKAVKHVKAAKAVSTLQIKKEFEAGFQKGIAEAARLFTKIAAAKAKLETELKSKLGKVGGAKKTKAATKTTTGKKRGRKAAKKTKVKAVHVGVVSSMHKRRGRPPKAAHG